MLLPARFGKYILLKEIEVGGMAAVYLAKAQGIGGFEKFLAIKKIYPQLSRSEDFVQMFISEARIAVELTHPNISHIYDLGEVDGDYFIAMEYIHGKDCYRLIKRCQARGRRIPIGLVCHIVLQVLEGLEYAHRKKDLAGTPMRIVHRDVSPRNVLLSYEGGVKLIDFGIAKAATLGEHTRVGTIKGKVNYMSPEQARGEELDARSDLFSAGLFMYELIHQVKLFAGGSEIKTLDLIRECKVPSIREQNPNLPDEIERILMKSLAKEREHRYASAQEFARDLQQFMARNDIVVGSSLLSEFVRDAFSAEVSAEERELEAFRQVTMESTDSVKSGGGAVRVRRPRSLRESAGEGAAADRRHSQLPRRLPG
jgi:serine/threonine protein kinase